MFDLGCLLKKNKIDLTFSVLSTKRWITELPLDNQFEAHRMCINALHSFSKSEEPLSRERLKMLIKLDENSQALQKDLCRQYFDNPEDLKQGEALWRSIYSLYWLLSHNYQAFIRNSLESSGNCDTAPYLQLITARTIRYFRLQIKWNYFRQMPIEPSMWKRLHRLYRLGELGKFSHIPVSLNKDGDSTTCAEEYKKILLMDQLTPVTLKPDQIETIDRWLQHWANLIELQPSPQGNVLTHCVELSQGFGVCRLVSKEMSGENFRYWNMANLVSALFQFKSKLVYALRTDTPSPDPSECHSDHLLELVNLITKLWMRPAAKRPAPGLNNKNAPASTSAEPNLYQVTA